MKRIAFLAAAALLALSTPSMAFSGLTVHQLGLLNIHAGVQIDVAGGENTIHADQIGILNLEVQNQIAVGAGSKNNIRSIQLGVLNVNAIEQVTTGGGSTDAGVFQAGIGNVTTIKQENHTEGQSWAAVSQVGVGSVVTIEQHSY
jgi:hypothetical protein